MAVKFEFYESPNTIGTRKKRYHARVVNRERISTDHLAQEIHHSSSLTVADIKATIIALSEKLAYHLTMILWRVVCAFDVMIDNFSPTNAFMSVDLPMNGASLTATASWFCTMRR